jgi:hypothetical protein
VLEKAEAVAAVKVTGMGSASVAAQQQVGLLYPSKFGLYRRITLPSFRAGRPIFF